MLSYSSPCLEVKIRCNCSEQSDPHSQVIKSWLMTMRIVSCRKVFSCTSLHELARFLFVTSELPALLTNVGAGLNRHVENSSLKTREYQVNDREGLCCSEMQPW